MQSNDRRFDGFTEYRYRLTLRFYRHRMWRMVIFFWGRHPVWGSNLFEVRFLFVGEPQRNRLRGGGRQTDRQKQRGVESEWG